MEIWIRFGLTIVIIFLNQYIINSNNLRISLDSWSSEKTALHAEEITDEFNKIEYSIHLIKKDISNENENNLDRMNNGISFEFEIIVKTQTKAFSKPNGLSLTDPTIRKNTKSNQFYGLTPFYQVGRKTD
jgi:hypothetical protein